MHVLTYDPGLFILRWGPTIIRGYMDGDMILITRLERKRFKTKVGGQGEVSRSRVRNDATNCKVRLKHTSITLRELYLGSQLGIKQTLSLVEIGGGAFFYDAAEAWIEEAPDPVIAEEEGVAEFMFATGPADFGQLASILAS